MASGTGTRTEELELFFEKFRTGTEELELYFKNFSSRTEELELKILEPVVSPGASTKSLSDHLSTVHHKSSCTSYDFCK